MSKKPKTDDLLVKLEDGVRAVLDDPDADVKDRMQAITAGVKIAQIKHKISDDSGGKHFFNKD